MLTENFPAAAALMEQAREDVLAFRVFPTEHWRKIWSTKRWSVSTSHREVRLAAQ